MSAAATALEAEVSARLARRRLVNLGVPGLILAYLVYAFFAFDVPGLVNRADPEKALHFVRDSVAYKIVTVRDSRSGEVEMTVESDNRSRFTTLPDWAVQDGDTTRIDLSDGYRLVIGPEVTVFTAPEYGDVRLTPKGREGVAVVLPPGPRPDWLTLGGPRVTERPEHWSGLGVLYRSFDAAPTVSVRLRATPSKIEAHRFFLGWENFWFAHETPPKAYSTAELWGLAFSGERVFDPAMSNAAYLLGAWWKNAEWHHNEVFGALLETLLMAFLGTVTAFVIALPLSFTAARMHRSATDTPDFSPARALAVALVITLTFGFLLPWLISLWAALFGADELGVVARTWAFLVPSAVAGLIIGALALWQPLLRQAARRLFDFLRGVDGLVWTIILTRSFGLGPLTGTLAIALTEIGTFGKLFSEALENIDAKQAEGVRATGASQFQRYRYGVIPQIMPVLLSQMLYYLESNTRSATVVGAICGGGIGLLLVQAIRTFNDWENVAYYVILTTLLVIAMDTVSGWLRYRLIKGGDAGVVVARPA